MEPKRRFIRVKCNYKTSVGIGNVVIIQANILNISLNGVLFELKQGCLFKKGEKWQIKFKLPKSDIVGQFESEVVHSSGNRAGLKFLHVDDDAMQHLRHLLESETDNSRQVADETQEHQVKSYLSS